MPNLLQSDPSVCCILNKEAVSFYRKSILTLGDTVILPDLSHNSTKQIDFHYVSDRYILVGNHRDAWVFGAVDPSSGTAIMMEISRVMGELVKSG